MDTRKYIFSMTLCVYLLSSSYVVLADSSFVVAPGGQATSSTCQSYVLALGLAFKKDKAFPIANLAQLRNAEVKIRQDIEAAFKKRNPSATKVAPNHDDIKAGFESFTSGVYRLNIEDVDIQQFSDRIASRTGVTTAGAVPDSFLFGNIVKDIVMSSAIKIGSDSYTAGHIFTLLGLDGPMNSTRKFLILNSAVKKQDMTRNACTEELPDDPGPYTASVSWRSLGDIKLKQFGDKYKVWTIDRK